MAKAVAVPYVIALILGIIVVAVIGYWFFVIAGGGGGTLSKTECQARYVAYCTQWSLAGYGNTKRPNGDAFTAAKNNPGCDAYKAELKSDDNGENCKKVLGQPATTR